ncbi:hypothetical protein ACF3DV_27870 [Chlorogloeopsis fritschii PCC 9212]|uniref:Uncharacterized protein n=1 Tax=Chlorogloeopsis fritschii PCC 6912 TaxID=211165 RepID=A0A3S0ZK97_CHLFR|nr:hypothetical protein [Chlorogloeopsis fritschii]RUR77889.1 hypothetical protein PCC6912_37700 [Chlorogloeopsis fritschii PCC 6912]
MTVSLFFGDFGEIFVIYAFYGIFSGHLKVEKPTFRKRRGRWGHGDKGTRGKQSRGDEESGGVRE